MPKAMGERCTARSKSTGEQCRQSVIGGGVCRFHGGKAPQVAAAREGRKLQMRAQAYGEVVERSPAEALLSASSALDASLQRLEGMAADAGGADPVLLKEIRSAATESARVAKLVQDAGLDERRLQLAERDQTDLSQVLTLALGAFGLEPSESVVREVVVEAVERVRSGDLTALAPRVPSLAQLEAAPGGTGAPSP